MEKKAHLAKQGLKIVTISTKWSENIESNYFEKTDEEFIYINSKKCWCLRSYRVK